MIRNDLNNPASRALLRAMMPMGTINGKRGLITGVITPLASEDGKPLVLISRTNNPDNDAVGNEVVMLTLEQAAFMLKALPIIADYLKDQEFPLPEIEETPFA